ncbi:hypothetical protein APLC1_3915 [Limnospira platensis C1]|nr:hypothetical protein APLC1_3915 [Arthrospira platensis C1]
MPQNPAVSATVDVDVIDGDGNIFTSSRRPAGNSAGGKAPHGNNPSSSGLARTSGNFSNFLAPLKKKPLLKLLKMLKIN